jgi:hypothetical protein
MLFPYPLFRTILWTSSLCTINLPEFIERMRG